VAGIADKNSTGRSYLNGAAIRAGRALLGWKLGHAAKASGLSIGHFWTLERGRPMNAEVARKIMVAFAEHGVELIADANAYGAVARQSATGHGVGR
jgi:hypothetical protein